MRTRIARMWHGRVPAAKADAYVDLMERVAIPDYRTTPGNLAAYVLRRDDDDETHVVTLTFWESLDAIRAFAGDPIETAKYYDFDADYLLELEPTVTHYTVSAADEQRP